MSTLGELLRAMPLPARAMQPAAVAPVDAEAEAQAAASPATSVREEQIRALVQQLFFRPESGGVRKAGFAPVESSAQTAALCLDVAKVLAAENKYDVGLIDATCDAVTPQERLQVPESAHFKVTWPVSSRLWLLPRRSWWREPGLQPITDRDLERLRDLMTEFDFSILQCAPVSWLTLRIAQNCDGLVLILRANKTRRLVASQIKEQLTRFRIPLLGTVLAERRLPVPQRLYGKL